MSSGHEFEDQLQAIEARSPEKAAIIGQYRRVAGAFNRLWAEIDKHTEGAAWKADGVGSCRVSPHLFETYVGGVVGQDIERLWEAKDADNPDDPYDGERCMFHRLGSGCILGDLKSPRCLSHIDGSNASEIKAKLGMPLPDMKGPLMTIQAGGMDVTAAGCVLHPEANADLVEQTVQTTEALIASIQTLPTITSGTATP